MSAEKAVRAAVGAALAAALAAGGQASTYAVSIFGEPVIQVRAERARAVETQRTLGHALGRASRAPARVPCDEQVRRALACMGERY